MDRFAGLNDTAGSASASFNALKTAHAYFTVLTPNATMAWDSGHDYSAALDTDLPEPATLALLAPQAPCQTSQRNAKQEKRRWFRHGIHVPLP